MDLAIHLLLGSGLPPERRLLCAWSFSPHVAFPTGRAQMCSPFRIVGLFTGICCSWEPPSIPFRLRHHLVSPGACVDLPAVGLSLCRVLCGLSAHSAPAYCSGRFQLRGQPRLAGCWCMGELKHTCFIYVKHSLQKK